MKERRFTNGVMVFFLFLFLVAGISSEKSETGEMPITTTSKEALQLFLQGRELADNAYTKEAFQNFEKALTLDSSFALAYLYLGINDTENQERGVKSIQKAISLASNVSEGERYFILGVQDLINGNPLNSKEKFEKVITLHPREKRAYLGLWNAYDSTRDYPPYIELLKKALSIDPNYAAAYNALGYIYSYMNNYIEAEKALKKCMELKPQDPNSYDSLAEILMKQGKYQESLETYRKALSLKPDFSYSQRGVIANFLFLNKPKDALKQAQEMFRTATEDANRQQALDLIAMIHIDQGLYEEALKVMQKSESISENNNDAFGIYQIEYQMGDLLLEKMNRPNEAKNHFHRSFEAVEKADISEEVKENARQNFTFTTVRVALKQGDLKTAKEKAEEYRIKAETRQNPGEIRTGHGLLGDIARYEKKWDTAIEEYGKHDQANPWVTYWLAEAYLGKGDTKKSKELLERTVHYNSLDNNFILIRQEAIKKLTEME